MTATDAGDKPNVLVLKLKESKKPAIKWTEDTIDNENLGRRSSKRKIHNKFAKSPTERFLLSVPLALLHCPGCCIFHKTKKFGESDSDESDSDTEVAKQQPPKKGRHPVYQRHHA
jgi:hypothetical protein